MQAKRNRLGGEKFALKWIKERFIKVVISLTIDWIIVVLIHYNVVPWASTLLHVTFSLVEDRFP